MRHQTRGRARGLGGVAVLTVAALGIGIGGCGNRSPLTYGALLPETGPLAQYGKNIRNGIELAVDEINAGAGGRPVGVLGGRPIQIAFRDTEGSPQMGIAAATELIEELHVPAIIGAVSSTVTLSLIPLIDKNEVILLSPASSSPRLTQEGGEWFFRVYPSDVVEGQRMARFCTDHAVATVAVIAVADDFGQGIADVFTEHYETALRRVVFREDFSGSLDEETALALADRVKEANPEAVFIAAYGPDVVLMLRALERRKCRVFRLSTSAVTPDVVAEAGSAAENLIFPQVAFDVNNPDPKVQAFVQAYRERFGSDPDTYAAHGYDAVGVLAQATSDAGIALPQQIRGALRRMNYTGVTGPIAFNLQGDVVQPPQIFAVLNGEIVPLEKYEEARSRKSVLGR